MTFGELKALVMNQTTNDAVDLADFEPYLSTYLNEGYDKLFYAFTSQRLAAGGAAPPLTAANDSPKLPAWSHRTLADYATWMLYRNGNQQRQQRGYVYQGAFEAVMNEALALRGRLVDTDGDGIPDAEDNTPRSFTNLYP